MITPVFGLGVPFVMHENGPEGWEGQGDGMLMAMHGRVVGLDEAGVSDVLAAVMAGIRVDNFKKGPAPGDANAVVFQGLGREVQDYEDEVVMAGVPAEHGEGAVLAILAVHPLAAPGLAVPFVECRNPAVGLIEVPH